MFLKCLRTTAKHLSNEQLKDFADNAIVDTETCQEKYIFGISESPDTGLPPAWEGQKGS